jgi:hypothetical protein
MQPEASLPFPPLVCILSQINPSHAPPFYFLKTYFNNLLPTPRSSKWFSFVRFPHQNPACISLLPHTCHMPPSPSDHVIFLDLVTQIIFNKGHKQLRSSLCTFSLCPLRTFSPCPITSSLLDPKSKAHRYLNNTTIIG